MNLVLCLQDNKEWSIQDFSSLDQQESDRLRHDLACIACGGKAYYRMTGRTGRPSFGARHIPGCKLVSPGWTAFRYLQ